MEKISSVSNLLHEEAPYNGKVFYLGTPESEGLDFEELEAELDGLEIDIEQGVDLDERDDLYIPPIYKSANENEDLKKAAMENVQHFNTGNVKGIVGKIRHYASFTAFFDQREMLVLDRKETRFLIFESEGHHYLLMLGARNLVEAVLDLIADDLRDMGFMVEEITITHDEFAVISEEIVDKLKITTVRGYTEPTIDAKKIIGDGYDEEREYKREIESGSVHGQQFSTKKVDGNDVVVQMSNDGLIRSYNNITLSSYLNMLANYVLPHLSHNIQSALYHFKPEGSSS